MAGAADRNRIPHPDPSFRRRPTAGATAGRLRPHGRVADGGWSR